MAHSTGTTSTITRGPSSSRPTLAQSSRMEAERRTLAEALIPDRVIKTLQASRRPSTSRLYEVTWQTFVSWCQGKSIIPTQASVPQILGFLQDGLDKGLKPNTLRRQVSALAATLDVTPGSALARDPMITRFLRGAKNLSPPVIHRYPTWDLPKVLRALTQSPFEPLEGISLKYLSLKTAFLIAITSARRISELSALSVREDLCEIRADRVILRLDPVFLTKVNTTFHRQQELVLPAFCPTPKDKEEILDQTLDVRRTLQKYILETKSFRKSEALFVNFRQSSLGRKVSATTIGCWLRSTIGLAYEIQGLSVPSGITAHSTRSAATTTAWANQVTIDQICRAATWASPSAFIRHYKIDSFASLDTSFGKKILQTVHKTV